MAKCLAAVLAVCLGGTAMAGTMQTVKTRKALLCGVVGAAQDWNKDDFHGDLSALGRAICGAAAAAVLGRAEAASDMVFPAESDALEALQAGRVDMVAGVTPSATRRVQYRAVFGPVIFWDSLGFLVHAAGGTARLSALDGKTLCYLDGTDVAATLFAMRAAGRLRFRPFPFQEAGEMEAGLAGGHCTAVGASLSSLTQMRASIGGTVRDLVLLPSDQLLVPLTVATRADDPGWSSVIGATVDALVLAEMLGVTRDNVRAMQGSGDPAVRHLLGADWSASSALGLSRDFAAREIGAVGDYGEVFARSVGLPRGVNAVCTHGGSMCAAPLK
jgi:general L-amino acid transport system substrate-binding protein